MRSELHKCYHCDTIQIPYEEQEIEFVNHKMTFVHTLTCKYCGCLVWGKTQPYKEKEDQDGKNKRKRLSGR